MCQAYIDLRDGFAEAAAGGASDSCEEASRLSNSAWSMRTDQELCLPLPASHAATHCLARSNSGHAAMGCAEDQLKWRWHAGKVEHSRPIG